MGTLLSVQALLVFGMAFLVDIVWGLYIRRSGQGKAFAAANYAALIMVFGAANAISYIGNHWLLAPIIAGNWLGTYAVVWWDHRKQQGAPNSVGNP
jgi:hypothetical protein